MKFMKTCRHCKGEIVKVEGQKARRFYCSHICYERFTSRVKYYRHHEDQKEKSRERSKDPKQIERVSKFENEYKSWAYENGLSIRQLRDYGIVFLRENPEVVETLRIMNNICHTKMSQEEKLEYKKQYYQKNRDKFLERSKKSREKKKLLNN